MKIEDIRDSKIDSILTNSENSPLKYKELNSGIVVLKDFDKKSDINLMFAKIKTDYFGGTGEQSSKLYLNGKLIFKSKNDNAINEALRLMGVVSKDKMDEFDTVGLGGFRTNESFFK